MKLKKKNLDAKLAKLHELHKEAYKTHNYKKAYEYAMEGHKLCPAIVQPLDDAMVSAINGGLWKEAIVSAKKILHRNPNHLNALDALSHAYCALEDYTNTQLYGLQALTKRHSEVLSNIALPNLPTLEDNSGKKIIAFSLYGDSSKYVESAVINAQIAKDIYPGWICRFYIDDSVPDHAVKRLLDSGAEVILADDFMQKMPKTMWRFLVLDDADCAYVIFRDADSVISMRESKAVQEWINSGKYFHIIRDYGSHTELLLAGMWGARVGAIPNIKQMISDYIESEELDSRFADQYFLRKHIWKYASQSLCSHDSLFNFLDPILLPRTDSPSLPTIGTAEYMIATASGNFADREKVTWQLFSKVSPLVNEDYSINLLPEERLVCEYQQKPEGNKLVMNIPKRYFLGIDIGASRIKVD